MKLIAYVIDGHDVSLRPAPAQRDWMDATDQRFAYRCLPLSIANAHGWEILCANSFTASWNGGRTVDAITITPTGEGPVMATTHFGHGVLTFHVPCVFRTEPGYDLIAQGPPNRPKHAITALSGIIETDWAPYTFTMNWVFTEPGIEVSFEKGEPFCGILPVKRGELEQFRPEVRLLSSDPALHADFQTWQESRARFNADLRNTGSPAQAQKWQKLYHRGVTPGGTMEVDDHRTRVKLRPFRSKDHGH